MLRGSLDDFTLPDIFRLLSFSKKTGKLEIVRGAGDGKVYFRDGEVYFAQSSIKREPLGQKLIRAGALTEGALMRALDQNAQTGERVGEILLREGAITEAQLIDGVKGQIEDAVFDLLRWEIGEFEFEAHERFTAEIPISVSVENLIMEASRKLDELEVMRKKIPSPDVVLMVAPSPPEGAREINITPDEWRLLVMVDGHRNVGEICQLASLDEFTGFRTLYGLISSGLVDVDSLGPSDEPSPIARPPIDAAPPPAPAEDDAEETVLLGPDPGLEEALQEPDLVPEELPQAGDVRYEVEAAEEVQLDDTFGYEPEAEPDVNAALEAVTEETFGHEETEPSFFDYQTGEDWREESELSPLGESPSAEAEVDARAADTDTFLTDILNAEPSVDQGSEQGAEKVDPDVSSEPVAEDLPQAAASEDESEPAAKVDRAEVVRELAGLFSDEEMQPRRARSKSDNDQSQDGEATPPKRRVEDDEEINKGLIGRFIDGVKGM
jgi:hypothetical protein